MAAELGEKLAKPLDLLEEGDSYFASHDHSVFAAGRNQMTLAMLQPGEGAESIIAGGVVTIRASVRMIFQLE
jgi:hypothetical protein